MKTSLHRTFKVVCIYAVLALLTACGGSSSVVEPLTLSGTFSGSRVIGLGDGYNDVGYGGVTTRFTVRDANNSVGSAVVEKLAPMFGGGSTGVAVTARQSLPTSGVFSYASGNSLVGSGTNSLQTQVTNLLSDVGNSFGSKDLIVITAGTYDLKTGVDAGSIATGILNAVRSLVGAQAKYVVVVLPFDLTTTPGGGVSAQDLFNQLSGQGINTIASQGNPILLVDMRTNFAILRGTGTYTMTPYCGLAISPSLPSGCSSITGQDVSTYFFADDYNLTPAGGLWVAQQVYNAAGVASWR